MGFAFVIMKFGDADLDSVYDNAIKPAIEVCGLEPKRVDQDNFGQLVKKEIDAFIEGADIIIGDVTGERPNCYCEIGYAMGLSKHEHLILTSREDHNPDHPGFKPGGPKVHFDLTNYPFIFWSQDDIDGFRAGLTSEIQRRQDRIAGHRPAAVDPWDEDWLLVQRTDADVVHSRGRLKGKMEIHFALEPPKPALENRALRAAAQSAVIKTFGWPIGIFLDQRPDHDIKARADGICASYVDPESSADWWTLRKNGDFYLMKTLFEDKRAENGKKLFWDTRIVRITETLLYCYGLYSHLGVDPNTRVHLKISHGGLADRQLSVIGNRTMIRDRTTTEDSVSAEIAPRLSDIDTQLTAQVKSLCEPLFELFDFFTLEDRIYTEIVSDFRNGKVS